MKMLKYALLGLGAVALALGAVLAWLAATFDPNAYKPEIIRLVKEKKNRTLKLEGDIRLSFWPNIGAKLGKVSLSEFGSEKEFAAVGDARVSLKVMPLLSKRIVVDEVSVTGARATVVRFRDGHTNIDDLLSKDDKAESAAVEFDIAAVSIRDSAFTFRDEAAGASYSASKLNLSTGRIANNVPTKIDLSVALAASKPKISLATALKSKLTFDLEKQVYTLGELSLEAKGDAADIRNLALKASGGVTAKLATHEFTAEKLSAAATGTSGGNQFDVKLDAPGLQLTRDKASGDKVSVTAKVTGSGSTMTASVALPGLEGSSKSFRARAMTLDLDLRQGETAVQAKISSPLTGSIDAQQVSLTALAAKLSVAGPGIPGKSLAGELTGSASVDALKQNAHADLAGKVADSSLKAKLAIASFKAPAVSFDIDVDQLDVDRYFPPRPAGQKPAGPEKPFDLTGLRNLNASGTLKIGSLKANHLKATNVRVVVKAQGGHVNIDPLAANFYQGSLASRVSINAAQAIPAFAVRHNMNGVAVGPLLKDLADNDMLEGRGNITLDVTTQGNVVSALKKGLNGSAALKVTDGALRGINIAGSIRDAKATLGSALGQKTQQADKTQKTDFSELSATFRIVNGVAHNNDLSLKSPLLRVGGEGNVNIGADSLDYVVKASIVATTKGQGGRDLANLNGVTVPVRVSGPLTAPSYQLDFGSMVTDAAKQKVQERVTSEVGKRLGGVLGGGSAGGGGGKDAGAKEGSSGGGSPADLLKGIFGR